MPESTPPFPDDRYPTSFEEFRDAWAAQDAGKGLAALMQKMILRLLNALVALLAEARARRLEAEGAAAGGEKGPVRCAARGDHGGYCGVSASAMFAAPWLAPMTRVCHRLGSGLLTARIGVLIARTCGGCPSPSRSPGSILGSSPRTGAGPSSVRFAAQPLKWRGIQRPRPPPVRLLFLRIVLGHYGIIVPILLRYRNNRLGRDEVPSVGCAHPTETATPR
jgi:hypothetical protein